MDETEASTTSTDNFRGSQRELWKQKLPPISIYFHGRKCTSIYFPGSFHLLPSTPMEPFMGASMEEVGRNFHGSKLKMSSTIKDPNVVQ